MYVKILYMLFAIFSFLEVKYMFIVIDGPDGCGKTTLSKALVDHINNRGIEAIYTFEPTMDNPFGCKIRELLKNSEIEDVNLFSNLFIHDRRHHLEKFIKPNLEKNKWIICDRYKYSALAYQQLQGIDTQYLIGNNSEFLIPDFVFILLPQNVDTLFQRINQRNTQMEYFEKKSYLDNVIKLYNKMLDYFPSENIFFLDAELSIENNIQKIDDIMLQYTNQNN